MKKIFIFFLAVTMILPIFTLVSCKEKEEVNAVVLVEFSQEEGDETPPEKFSTQQQNLLKEVFSTGENSLYNFIYQNSNGKSAVKSKIVTTVKISKTVDYFMPKYSYDNISDTYTEINPVGYDNRTFKSDGSLSREGFPSAERYYREQEFIYLATAGVNKKLFSDELKSLILVPSKLNRSVEVNSLLWAHQATYYFGDKDLSSAYYMGDSIPYGKQAKLGDKSINDYVLIPYAFIDDGENVNLSTLCHEYMHVLGAPDYYSYDGVKEEGVGEFDVMGDYPKANPTVSLAYTRSKLGWLKEGEDILNVSKSGEYVLYPSGTDGKNQAYKIVTAEFLSKGESFYVEYRKKTGKYSDPTSEGLIIYRVNEENGYLNSSGEKGNSWLGNAYGEKEVYIFRFWRELGFGLYEEREEITKNGICYATVGNKIGYTSYGNADGEENAISYSDGTNSNIVITYLGENADGSVRFSVDMPQNDYSSVSFNGGVKKEIGNRLCLYFGKVGEETTAYYITSDKKISNPDPKKLVEGKYGKVSAISTTFLKADLPLYDGLERYVYVCYEEGGTFSKVDGYYVDGIKNVRIFSIIAVAVGVGIIVPSVCLATIKKIRKKARK